MLPFCHGEEYFHEALISCKFYFYDAKLGLGADES